MYTPDARTFLRASAAPVCIYGRPDTEFSPRATSNHFCEISMPDKVLVHGNSPQVMSAGEAPARREPYWISIFVGAFLLFSVQLLLGKYFLPWFGGTPAMWTTCMFFFQTVLLAGYAYAHALTRWFTPRMQGYLHSVLLLTALAVLVFMAVMWGTPITPSVSWRPQSGDHPVWSLTILLAVSAGLPYFVLSSTGPLLQSWFTRTHPGHTPYRLYSLSNLGSLLGLLTYPLLVEPWFTLRAQARIWTTGFFVFAVVCGYCALRMRRITALPKSTSLGLACQGTLDFDFGQAKPTVGSNLLWLSLAACASVMFLATTNQICQDVAVIPFLWVLPLSLYLLSFIICFDEPRWYSRAAFHPAFALAIFLACLLLLGWGIRSIFVQIAAHSFILFVSCMVCHGELALSKPDSRHLTSFYLMVALGGAMGGVLVALIFPHIFHGFWEYQLGLWFSVLLLFVVLVRDKSSWLYCSPWGLPGIAVAAALLPGTTSVVVLGRKELGGLFVVLPVLVAAYFLTRGGRKGFDSSRARAIPIYCGTALLVVGATLVISASNETRNSVVRARNFYGVLNVRELAELPSDWRAYSLFHGRISHGYQFLSEAKRRLPTSYYGLNSGVGMAIIALQKQLSFGTDPQNLRAGFVGLGVGTLAAYGNPGDYFRFYEINPEVIRIARDARYFTFLRDCRAALDVISGDARLSMESELNRGQPQNFNLLAIDAFSGDAIPVHLLTEEAFQIYLKHVKTDGIIAVHITNAHFDLQPVLRRVAERFKLRYALLHTDGDGITTTYSDWVLLSRDPTIVNSFPVSARGRFNDAIRPDIALWTDNYSNLFFVLRR
jgi:hypothetical protein